MKNKEFVLEIMTKELETIDVKAPVTDAEKIFKKRKIRHLPVMADENLVGILSLTDVMRMSFGDTYENSQFEVDSAMFDMFLVGQIMKANPKTVYADDDIKDVADILTKEEFHALPVLNSEEKLVGIVTTTDIIKHLMSLL